MSGVQWSLGAELCDMAGVDSAPEACLKLGVLREGAELIELKPLSEWYRSGAESHAFVFEVVSNTRRESFILKAWTPFAAGGRLEESFERTLARRRMIHDAGGHVPRLYGAHRCTVLEPFIRYTVVEAATQLGPSILGKIKSDVIAIAVALDTLRFEPVSWLEDLRADESGAFLVDFGADLGEPGVAVSPDQCRQQADAFISRLPDPR